MLDEASLARLAEMGIDVYRPRARDAQAPSAATVDAARETAAGEIAPTGAAVALVVPSVASKPAGLLADVVRALRFARIGCSVGAASDVAAIEAARALVLFGDAQVRAVGAQLPSQRQREIGWVVTGEPGALSGDARSKRALWSELRRVVRALRKTGE